MIEVNVIQGDIARIQADALITVINSGGMWFGGIDGVIMRVAGDFFHSQASAKQPLKDGQTVVARGHGDLKHRDRVGFESVVFVIDDLQRPLSAIIFNGLVAASSAGFKSVTLPTIRMGVMLGVVEKSTEEAINEMVKGVQVFFAEVPDASLKKVTFVVYNDPQTYESLKSRIEKFYSRDLKKK